MRLLLSLAVSFITLGTVTTEAIAVTITFEDVVVGEYAPTLDTSQGYSLSLSDGALSTGALGVQTWGNSKVLYSAAQTSGDLLWLTQSEGQLFSLESMDVHFYSVPLGSVYPVPVEFRAEDALGNIIAEATFTGLGWETVTFGSNWTGISRVAISASYQTSHAHALDLDNIVVTTVPVPAALWMFGSALAGLGWLRRKQFS